jgi:SPP1 family predicted phage head-tail adaptor
MRCVVEYDQKIIIKKLSGTADAHGFIDNTDAANWSELCASYAKVQSKGGREFWKIDRVNADVSHVWFCPYSKALHAATPDMQLIHEGVIYEISSVVNVNLANQEIQIQTKRAV